MLCPYCEPLHAHSPGPDVATDAACASMSTTTPTTTTTTTTTRDRGDRYGPMEWAQSAITCEVWSTELDTTAADLSVQDVCDMILYEIL